MQHPTLTSSKCIVKQLVKVWAGGGQGVSLPLTPKLHLPAHPPPGAGVVQKGRHRPPVQLEFQLQVGRGCLRQIQAEEDTREALSCGESSGEPGQRRRRVQDPCSCWDTGAGKGGRLGCRTNLTQVMSRFQKAVSPGLTAHGCAFMLPGSGSLHSYKELARCAPVRWFFVNPPLRMFFPIGFERERKG